MRRNGDLQFGNGERFLVVGVGRSGLASARALQSRGATVIATDDQPQDRLATALAALHDTGAKFVSPAELAGVLKRCDAAILSPGVPVDGALVRRIRDAQLPLISEVELAYRLCSAPIIAVTGTKGKSTTCALLGAIFRFAGKPVRVGGNIGNPLVSETLRAQPNETVIAEISSFQLETIERFKPKVSAILNIFEDHLDRYASFDDYAAAKYRILENQDGGDVFVGNLDDPRVACLQDDARLKARPLWFSLNGSPHAQLVLDAGALIYRAENNDPIEIMRIAEIPLAGRHNAANVMAAQLIGLACGIEPRAIRHAVTTFTPMAHRLQVVAHRGGVTYVNDSKATTPRAVAAALDGLAGEIVLIAGGKSKGSSFDEMGAAISRRAKAVVLIGSASEEIAATIDGPPVERCETLAEAVAAARRLARSGDTILLSPGCASFDMFASAEARGEEFTRVVDGA